MFRDDVAALRIDKRTASLVKQRPTLKPMRRDNHKPHAAVADSALSTVQHVELRTLDVAQQEVYARKLLVGQQSVNGDGAYRPRDAVAIALEADRPGMLGGVSV